MMTRRTAVLGCVAMLVVASCGSGDDVSSGVDLADTPTVATTMVATDSTVGATTTIVTSSTTTVEPSPTITEASTTTVAESTDTSNPNGDADLSDRELAETALFTLDDFPEGWTHLPAESAEEDDDDAFDTMMAECIGIPSDEIRLYRYDDTKADSGEFSAPGGKASVEHSVKLAPDEASAILAMEQYGADAAPGCYEEGLNTSFVADFHADPANEGTTIGDISVEFATVGQFMADDVVMLLVEIPFEAGGESASQFLSIMYQRQGRALTQLQFASFAQPFPPDGVAELGQASAARLALIG